MAKIRPNSRQRKGRFAVCARCLQANEHPFSSGDKGRPFFSRRLPLRSSSSHTHFLQRKGADPADQASASAKIIALHFLGSSSDHVNNVAASTKAVVQARPAGTATAAAPPLQAAATGGGLSALLGYDDNDDW
jgi:hypothetical protein